MTSMQNQGFAAPPNVLRDQTLPNTLAGLGPSAEQRPFRLPGLRLLPLGALGTAMVVSMAVLAILLGRAA
jgi:hypothetical protein